MIAIFDTLGGEPREWGPVDEGLTLYGGGWVWVYDFFCVQESSDILDSGGYREFSLKSFPSLR